MSWRIFSLTLILSLLGCKEEPLKEPPTPPDMEALKPLLLEAAS